MANNFDLFNKKLIEMLDDLILVLRHECPDQVNQFEGFKILTNTCVIMDNTTPQKLFNKTVSIPYEKYILEKNEKFFLDQSYEEVIEPNLSIDSGSLVDKMKSVWRNLDSANKDTMWKYMQVLVALNRRCMN